MPHSSEMVSILVCLYLIQVETIRASGLDVTLVLASAVAEPSVPPSSVPQVRLQYVTGYCAI